MEQLPPCIVSYQFDESMAKRVGMRLSAKRNNRVQGRYATGLLPERPV